MEDKKRLLRFDNPKRIAELNPEGTLSNIGVNINSVVFDYGAGTGAFSIPASKIAHMVYAYDIKDEMLEIITDKVNAQNVNNITLLNPAKLQQNLGDIWADFILLITVYHEIDDKDLLFEHFASLIKDGGRIAVIEFHKKESSMGPPVSHRIDKEDLKDDFSLRGYTSVCEIDLGENFYLVCFEK